MFIYIMFNYFNYVLLDMSSSSLLDTHTSQCSLTSTSSGGPGICSYPWSFELEYLNFILTSPNFIYKNYNPAQHYHTFSFYQHQQQHQSPPSPMLHYCHHNRHHSCSILSNREKAHSNRSIVNSDLGKVRAMSASHSLPPNVHLKRVWIYLRTPEEKADWIATLLSIQYNR